MQERVLIPGGDVYICSPDSPAQCMVLAEQQQRLIELHLLKRLMDRAISLF
jgi:hypothetical protein